MKSMSEAGGSGDARETRQYFPIAGIPSTGRYELADSGFPGDVVSCNRLFPLAIC
jgi:hypothetical protein